MIRERQVQGFIDSGVQGKRAASKQQTANSKQQTANSKQQTANSKQQTANSMSPFIKGGPGAHPVRVRSHVQFVPRRAAPQSASGRQRGGFFFSLITGH
jgi:hypothetical protein